MKKRPKKKVYHVSYDLKGATTPDYRPLWAAMERYESIRIVRSTYLVATDQTAEQLYQSLRNYLGVGRIFISEVTSNRQGFMSKKAWEWLKKMKPKQLQPAVKS
jgi:hypothetical protein